MYRPVIPPDERIFWGDAVVHPVATLSDESGGRAHVVVDDNCYVVLLQDENLIASPTAWLFPEVMAVLKNLPPNPKEDFLGRIKEVTTA